MYVELDACKRLLCLDCLDKAGWGTFRHAPAIGAALLSSITAFPTLGPLRIVFTLGMTHYTLYGVGCRHYHNGKNSSHGMIVVWLLQSDTNLQLFYESKKSFLKYFCFQPLNLHFQPPKLTFRGWERPQKRNNKCSLRWFTTTCCHGKTRATTSTKNTMLSISHAQNRAWSSYAMARKGVMKWRASRGHNPAEMKQQETTLRKGSCGTIKRNQVLWETKINLWSGSVLYSSDELTLCI